MANERKVRILVGKAGLDGHDRGAKIVARALRDAEDVDAIGLSILSGAHNYLFPEIIRLLEEKGADDIVVFGGGIIPKDDIPGLLKKGVKSIFEPGTATGEIINWVRENVSLRNP
jgi:methylmalonyl-CoA mutase C-terminal domain/subunit